MDTEKVRGRGSRGAGPETGVASPAKRGAKPGRKKRAGGDGRVAKKLSHTKKPAGMSLEQWQLTLRREFGRAQDFAFKRIGPDALFSEYLVRNPKTGREYRVAVRGREPGTNYCACRDFAVNTLGTCKHIEFLLSRLEKRSGAKTALARGFVPAYSEVFLRYGLERKAIFRPGTDCPAALRRQAAEYFGEGGELKGEAVARFEEFLKGAHRFDHELRVYDDALNSIARLRDDAHRQQAIDAAFPDGEESKAFDKLLRVPLYGYQRKGALFAARAGRCLLADDMGLGKTIQAIAAAEILAPIAGVERVLIVCPTSLKHQWKQEIEKFTSRSVVVVEGLLAARAALYKTDSFYKITNYDVIHRDLKAIRDWEPDLIVLDEAQRIKNWKTRTAQSVKSLESDHAIVLTGTPLENRLEELHSIVEFVDRFRLGPAFRFLHEHQQTDENGRVVGYRNLSRISQTLREILLRRNKAEVLKELPERLEKKYFVPMTPQQMQYHTENQETVAKIAAKWRRMGFLTEKDQRSLMIALQNMRMSCNSTFLLDHVTDFGVKSEELVGLLAEILEDPDAKAVVFSQWLRTHELLQPRLEKRNWDYVLFHGGVPGPHRKDLVSRFKEDPACRVFLSTDAGGVGLNLQNANAVINMDMPWNPAVLEQRIGRVHRLGQRRPVCVVNFISQGTIEEGMLQVIDFKKSLFTGVLDGTQDEVFLGGSRLKRFMETVDQSVNRIPTPMPAAVPEDWADDGARGQTAYGEPQPPAEDWAATGAATGQGALDEATAGMVRAAVGAPAVEEDLDSTEVRSAVSAHAADEYAAAGPRAVAATPPIEWSSLIETGLSFLGKLGEAMRGFESVRTAPAPGGQEPDTTSASAKQEALPDSAQAVARAWAAKTARNLGPFSAFLHVEEGTGKPCLKLPVPSADLIQRTVDLLKAWTRTGGEGR